MKKRGLIVTLAATATLVTSLEAVADIKMGVFPRRPVAMTHKLFCPLAERLQVELGEKGKLIAAKGFSVFWTGLKASQEDASKDPVVAYSAFLKPDGEAMTEYEPRENAGETVERRHPINFDGEKLGTMLVGMSKKRVAERIVASNKLSELAGRL